MFDIPRFYISSCSNSIQLVVLHPIIVSILFQHYKELIQLISEVEHIEARINKHRRLTIREKKKKNTCARNDSQSYQNSNLSKFKQKRKVTKICYYIFSLCQTYPHCIHFCCSSFIMSPIRLYVSRNLRPFSVVLNV
jgi:sensor c-di-GMP phosphodiesterase-like protein